MRKTLLTALAALLPCAMGMRAQVVTTDPSPVPEDAQNVVVYFHADQGNKGLMGLDGSTPVYAHTGVDIVSPTGEESWKYAPSWEANNPKYQMVYEGTNLWKLNIGDLRTYYGVGAEETIKRLCFVFRNADGSLKGTEADGGNIYVDVDDSSFQLAFRKSVADVISADKNVKFTATTTLEADITIYLNGVQIAHESGVKSLAATQAINSPGTYEAKAVATLNGKTLSATTTLVYATDSQPATDGVLPPMGLTKNADGSYTFCLAAPEKTSVMLFGSWNGYKPNADYTMKYVETQIEGATFRYFKTTVPGSVTGTEFGYYYLVDYKTAVGDPYARLVLDPSNDKYIPASVYPNMPQYPEGLVPNNTVIAWHADNLLDYNWKTSGFTAPSKENLVIYELLIRDFTGTEGAAKGNGTVRSTIDKLGYLSDLGVNVIELLPVNEFNGNVSWGYNPNFYFAPDKAYGTPQDYKELIDKCHSLGIAVVLDVVFNQSDWLHPWYRMYAAGSNPFFNQTAPHAYSVLNDWHQGYPLVQQQWRDMLKFWLSEYKVDGFRFDLVKGLGDNDSYSSSSGSATDAYNASRVARMKDLHAAMKEVNPKAYVINELLGQAKEENEMAADGELNWMNLNNAGCQFAMGYSSSSNLNAMWATKASRTAGSTVAYLESHDEERMGYKQKTWGVAGVKGNDKVSKQRIGGAAAQMILVPGSHMIWQFSEMGNSQTTKGSNGDNLTGPKIVDWNALEDPNVAGLVQSYTEMINIRLQNPELFADGADYGLAFNGWANGRYAWARSGNKELYLAINPNTDKSISVTANFSSTDNAKYYVASKSYDSNPTFDVAAKTITVEPNCYAVVTTRNISGVEDMVCETEGTVTVSAVTGGVRVSGFTGCVTVYGLDGMETGACECTGTAVIPVSRGVYVVRTGGKAHKVYVK